MAHFTWVLSALVGGYLGCVLWPLGITYVCPQAQLLDQAGTVHSFEGLPDSCLKWLPASAVPLAVGEGPSSPVTDTGGIVLVFCSRSPSGGEVSGVSCGLHRESPTVGA